MNLGVHTRTCGIGVDHLLGTTEELVAALVEMDDEHHRSAKELRRRVLGKQSMPSARVVAELKTMVDHEEGLLNAIETDLIQIAYDINNNEESRLAFIRTLNATIEFSKALALTHVPTLES